MQLPAESRILELYKNNAKNIKNRAAKYALKRNDNYRMIFSSILCFEEFGKETPKREICNIIEQHISNDYPFSERQYYSFNGTYPSSMSINSCLLFIICLGLNLPDSLLLLRFHNHDLLFEFASEEEKEVLYFLYELTKCDKYKLGKPNTRFEVAEQIRSKGKYNYISKFEG